jgi:hypothetical protein
MTFKTTWGMVRAPLEVPKGRVSLFIAVGVAILESEKGKKEREIEGNE